MKKSMTNRVEAVIRRAKKSCPLSALTSTEADCAMTSVNIGKVEAVLDSRHYGINFPTLETATRSGKYAIQTILEAEDSDLRIVPFDRPLHARKFKLAR